MILYGISLNDHFAPYLAVPQSCNWRSIIARKGAGMNECRSEGRRFMKAPHRFVVVLLGLASALTMSAVLAGSSSKVRDGISFGDVEHLSGVYFTNFENSTFVRCDRKKAECREWAGSRESYDLRCEPAACIDLEARIKTLNGTHDRWGLFTIDFTGRRSIGPGQSRGLGDPAKKVLVEHIESFALLETE